ncbi:soluble guanylate cyclase 89Db [Penaeus vannamei]|uniref:soluble guanylate cyclase 89Db n=1 Tax=Penaeus vannamei TaxID=6689 RepID=UPI00387F6486
MYGMLLSSIMHFGQVEYGELTWERVKEEAGCKTTEFTNQKIYDDNLIIRLAEACANILGQGDHLDYLRVFGRWFVRFCSDRNYDKMLRITGRHFCQFLTEMDNLHSQMKYGFPKMKSPSMVVTEYDSNGAVLLYRSVRKGYSHYLMGQLLQIANDFYHLPLEVTILKEEHDEQPYCTTFRLDFRNDGFMQDMLQRRAGFNRTSLPSFTLGKLTCDKYLFDFSVIILLFGKAVNCCTLQVRHPKPESSDDLRFTHCVSEAAHVTFILDVSCVFLSGKAGNCCCHF